MRRQIDRLAGNGEVITDQNGYGCNEIPSA
jgi:hypothetical protein